MSYINRIAEDWIETHSDDDLIGSFNDPLLLIEVVMNSSSAWGWLIILDILERDIEGKSLIDLVYGPLDSWINRNANNWIDTIEEEARGNARLQWALGGLIRAEEFNMFWERIAVVGGVPWPGNDIPNIPEVNK